MGWCAVGGEYREKKVMLLTPSQRTMYDGMNRSVGKDFKFYDMKNIDELEIILH